VCRTHPPRGSCTAPPGWGAETCQECQGLEIAVGTSPFVRAARPLLAAGERGPVEVFRGWRGGWGWHWGPFIPPGQRRPLLAAARRWEGCPRALLPLDPPSAPWVHPLILCPPKTKNPLIDIEFVNESSIKRFKY